MSDGDYWCQVRPAVTERDCARTFAPGRHSARRLCRIRALLDAARDLFARLLVLQDALQIQSGCEW